MLVLRTTRFIVLGGIAAAVLAGPALAGAGVPPVHEIPSDATIQAYIKPDGQRLYLIIRVPLRAMRDLDFPQRGPGYLDIPRADDQLRNAAMLWVGAEMALYEGDARLEEPTLVAARASIPSDRSFRSYEEALAHVTGPRLADETQLYWEQAMLDVLFEYVIQSDRSEFSIDPNLERLALRVVTVLRFVSPDGPQRVFQYAGDPGLVRLDPRWHQAALRFVGLGFSHILDGIDHLLFLLCLVIPFRRVRALVLLVTAFTVAHSITLIGSAFNLAPNALWFPPLVETLIAASIVYMALENVLGASLRRRWMITFAFGLVHGFGFSFGLRETLQFGGSHLLTSLLAFNVGVELGQLFALALLIPALELVYRFALKERERVGTIVLSALVAHTGWHWMTARGAVLGQYQWPAFNVARVAGAIGWLAAIAGMAWVLFRLLRSLTERIGARSAAAGAAD